MHSRQALSNYNINETMNYMRYPHLTSMLHSTLKNIKKVLRSHPPPPPPLPPSPPCSFPMASRKGDRIHCRRVTYQRQFYQIELADAMSLSTKRFADRHLWQTEGSVRV